MRTKSPELWGGIWEPTAQQACSGTFWNLNGSWNRSGLFVGICVEIFTETFQGVVSFSTRLFCYPEKSSQSFAAAQRIERSFATHCVSLPPIPCHVVTRELGDLSAGILNVGGKVVLAAFENWTNPWTPGYGFRTDCNTFYRWGTDRSSTRTHLRISPPSWSTKISPPFSREERKSKEGSN